MIHKFAQYFRLPKIRQQIFLIFLLCSIIPIGIFGLFAINSARRQMLSQYQTQLQTDAVRVNSTFFDITTSIRTGTSSIIDNQNYWEFFNQPYTPDASSTYKRLKAELQTYHSNTAAISSIGIYTTNPQIPEDDYIHSSADGFEEEPWFSKISTDEYNVWVVADYEDRFHHSNCELTLIERLVLKNSTYDTFLVTRLDSNYLRNRLLTNNHVIMISMDDGDIFFSSNRDYLHHRMPKSSEFHHQMYSYIGPLELDETSMLTSFVSFIPYQLNNHFYILVGDRNAYNNINSITRIYLIILLFATFVPLILILLFSSYFSGRIETLKHAMHQASLGDYNIIDQFHGDDELADTFEDLKVTVQKIHEKEARYYEAQITRQQLINTQQEMEFKMLASQINPHFLYNTLETIRMQALSYNNRDVADSINLLGKSMHYVLENTGTKSTTIARELNHVLTYLKIQQLRFGDRVNYIVHVPPYLNLEQFEILPLLLQPIVENAVLHGLEAVTNNGLVTIDFILEEPNFYITIEDNGDGMDEEALQALRKYIVQEEISPNSSIGLRNIDQRLKLRYGKEYGLTIDSVLHEGTTLTLTLPLEQIIHQTALNEILLLREQYLSQDIEDE